MFTVLLCAALQGLGCRAPVPAQPESLIFGLFIASIEEGARVFTPVRLLPFDHPDADHHEFPNAMVNYRGEVDLLVRLGEAAGLRLRTTLQRYPQPPTDAWPYPEFAPPPMACMSAWTEERAPQDPKLVGLRGLLVVDGKPLVFIVDTRALTLRQRGMDRPTSMGLDLTRAQLLELLSASVPEGSAAGCRAIVYPGQWVQPPTD